MKRLNDDGSAGALVTFVVGLVFLGLIIVFFGPVLDRVIVAGAYGNLGAVVSQDRVDTLNMLLLGWKALPFVLLFGWGIWYLKTQLEKVPGVD